MKKAIYIIILATYLFSIHISAGAENINKKPVQTKIEKGYQSIQETTFREIFIDHICKKLGKEKSDIIVSRFKVLGNKHVPEGKIYFKNFLKDERRLTGYVRLISVVNVNGVARNTVRISAWVDLFESVVCTCRDLKKGDIIKEEDLYLSRRNISRLSKNILNDISDIIGKRVKNTIKEGMCFKEWMLERPPILNKGDIVMILAETSTLRVTAQGKVLEKAYPGELVRVKNAMSEKEIYARVIDNSTVIVDF